MFTSHIRLCAAGPLRWRSTRRLFLIPQIIPFYFSSARSDSLLPIDCPTWTESRRLCTRAPAAGPAAPTPVRPETWRQVFPGRDLRIIATGQTSALDRDVEVADRRPCGEPVATALNMFSSYRFWLLGVPPAALRGSRVLVGPPQRGRESFSAVPSLVG